MKDKRASFIQREKWIWRIHLGLSVGALVSIGLLYALQDLLREVAPWLSQVYLVLFLGSALLFLVSIVQLLTHLFRNRKWAAPPRIWRSVVTFFTSPVVSAIYYAVLFVLLLSMASCNYSG